MADFETLIFCVSLISSEMCKDLVTGYSLYLARKSSRFPINIRFQIDFINHTLLLWA